MTKTLNELYREVLSYETTYLMPMVFLGHGSPMNAIEDNVFSQQWRSLGALMRKPRAIVCISAHWETRGTFVTTNPQPETIHDFYGFPRELFAQLYPAEGSPELAADIIRQVKQTHIIGTDEWGLDHGTWSVLKHVYPEADIPVIQISLDHYKDAAWHYQFAQELRFLRTKGILIVGSGNMIHNLRILQVPSNDFSTEHGYDWAFEMNEILKKKILDDDHQSLIDYRRLHKDAMLAIPTAEHYMPMLYVLGMKNESEQVTLFNDRVIAGSLNMTSFIVGR